jgi:hypothetical protein
MAYCKIEPATSIHVSDYAALRRVIPNFRDPARMILVACFCVARGVTLAQQKRLPKAVRSRLVQP